MFGEGASESPRMASPWARRSHSSSPLAYHAASDSGSPCPATVAAIAPTARRVGASSSSTGRRRQHAVMKANVPARSSPLIASNMGAEEGDKEDGFFALDLDISNAFADTHFADSKQAASQVLDERIASAKALPMTKKETTASKGDKMAAACKAPASKLCMDLEIDGDAHVGSGSITSQFSTSVPSLSWSFDSDALEPSPVPQAAVDAGLSASMSSSLFSLTPSLPSSLSQPPPRGRRRYLAPEPDSFGNLEYKWRITPASQYRFDKLVTQLKWRLLEGGGCAIYEIGVLDNGALVGIQMQEMRASLDALCEMARVLGARVVVRRCIALRGGASEDATDNDAVQWEDELPELVALDENQARRLLQRVDGLERFSFDMIANLPHTFVGSGRKGRQSENSDDDPSAEEQAHLLGISTPGRAVDEVDESLADVMAPPLELDPESVVTSSSLKYSAVWLLANSDDASKLMRIKPARNIVSPSPGLGMTSTSNIVGHTPLSPRSSSTSSTCSTHEVSSDTSTSSASSKASGPETPRSSSFDTSNGVPRLRISVPRSQMQQGKASPEIGAVETMDMEFAWELGGLDVEGIFRHELSEPQDTLSPGNWKRQQEWRNQAKQQAMIIEPDHAGRDAQDRTRPAGQTTAATPSSPPRRTAASRKTAKRRLAAVNRREKRRVEMLRKEREGMGIFDAAHPEFYQLDPDLQTAVTAAPAPEQARFGTNADAQEDELARAMFNTSFDALGQSEDDVGSNVGTSHETKIAATTAMRRSATDAAGDVISDALVDDSLEPLALAGTCRLIIEALVVRDLQQHETHINFHLAA